MPNVNLVKDFLENFLAKMMCCRVCSWGGENILLKKDQRYCSVLYCTVVQTHGFYRVFSARCHAALKLLCGRVMQPVNKAITGKCGASCRAALSLQRRWGRAAGWAAQVSAGWGRCAGGDAARGTCRGAGGRGAGRAGVPALPVWIASKAHPLALEKKETLGLLGIINQPSRPRWQVLGILCSSSICKAQSHPALIFESPFVLKTCNIETRCMRMSGQECKSPQLFLIEGRA